jgi:hypothetical protein
MAHNVVIKVQTQSFNVDALNRTAIYAGGNLDNCSVVALDSKSAGIGHWVATLPAEGTQTGPYWMIASPEVIFVDKAHGGSADPRDFENIAGRAMDAFCPQIGDQIEMTAANITNADTKVYLNANTSGYFTAADSASAKGGLVLKKVGTNTLKVGDGAIAPAVVPTYVYEVIENKPLES